MCKQFHMYVKKCNIFRQILNVWVKLILKENFLFFQYLALPKDPQSFSPYHTISAQVNSGQTKKVCSSDVKHCLISILKLKMMVKIGVISISFSNPTFHFRDTADFTSLKTVGGIQKGNEDSIFLLVFQFKKERNQTVLFTFQIPKKI